MTTDAEKLAQIAALCDARNPSDYQQAIWSHELRTILAEPGPAAPPDGWFPFGSHVEVDGPLEVSAEMGDDGLPLWERHVAGPGVPSHNIGRDALEHLLSEALRNDYPYEPGDNERLSWEWVEDVTTEILALVRPVEGVTLTPEEARRAVGWLDMSNLVPEDDDLALAARLEASA